MKILFEEYGRAVLTAFAALVLLAIILIRYDIVGYIGDVADLDNKVQHSQSADALRDVVERAKPTANFENVELRIYKNHALQPLKNVVFERIENGVVVETVSNVEVISILYCDSEGNTTEMIRHYNKEDKVIVLNPAHYSEEHKQCSDSEFTKDSNGHFCIPDGALMNSPGVVTVTYTAMDSEGQLTTASLTFAVDARVS